MFNNSEKKNFSPIVLQQYKVKFKTIDGEEHNGLAYNYVASNRINTSVIMYIMDEIMRDGYVPAVSNGNYTMHPLCNIISIEFILINEKMKQSTKKYESRICFETEEVNNMDDL